MIEIGNWVRINIRLCDPMMDCGHKKRHHLFNGRVGVLDREACPVHRLPLHCAECGKENTDNTDHIFGICFEGEHAWFKESEFEDLGIDLMASVPTSQKELVPAGM